MLMALFFFGGACGGRRDKPNQHGARTDASPLACCRVIPCVVCYLLASLPCTEPSTTHAPMFLVRTCRSKAVSVRTPKLAIPGPQSAPCAGLKCQIPLEMQHKEGTGVPGSACGAPQAPAARAGLVWLWPALFGVVFFGVVFF